MTKSWPSGTAVAYNGQSLTLIHKGSYISANSKMPNWQAVVEKYKQFDPDGIIALIKPVDAIKTAVNAFSPNATVVVDESKGSVIVDGEPLHGVIVQRIISASREGIGYDHLVNFVRKLRNNPSHTAVNELFLFLESSDTPLPITSEGNFLAYKKVRADYKDIHSGTMDNSVGNIVEMPRNKVDDNRNSTCSSGLHFCSFGYLKHFRDTANSRVVILEIDPADVVSIPSDYNNHKGRACRYKVIAEHEQYIQTSETPYFKSDYHKVEKPAEPVHVEPEVQTSTGLVDWTATAPTPLPNSVTGVNPVGSGNIALSKVVPQNANATTGQDFVTFGTRKAAREFAAKCQGKVLDTYTWTTAHAQSVLGAVPAARWVVKTAY